MPALMGDMLKRIFSTGIRLDSSLEGFGHPGKLTGCQNVMKKKRWDLSIQNLRV